MIILGAGSQARVVVEIIRAAGKHIPRGYVEAGLDASRIGQTMLGLKVLGDLSTLQQIEDGMGGRTAAVAIGDNRKRAELFAAAIATHMILPVIAHPTSVVSPTASIGDGTVLAAQSFVGTQAKVGVGCVINTGASVDHDNVIGDFVHVAVGARLAGNVTVGAFTTIGAGAVVIPGITIGEGAVVGAGAVVIRDVPPDTTVVGNPARARV